MNKDNDLLLAVRRALKKAAAREAADEHSPAADADTDAKAAS